MDSLIETGIPVPAAPARTRAGNPVYDAWRKLAVDQSVFIANKKLSTVTVYKASEGLKALREAGQTWRIAAAEKAGVPGVRVWRLT